MISKGKPEYQENLITIEMSRHGQIVLSMMRSLESKFGNAGDICHFDICDEGARVGKSNIGFIALLGHCCFSLKEKM